MKDFFRWLWEPLNLLSRALRWAYGHPKHVIAGLVAIVILSVVFPVQCRSDRESTPRDARPFQEPVRKAEPELPVLQPMPPRPVPKDYTDDPGAAIRDLESLGF